MILVNFILWKNWFFQHKQKKQNTTQHQTTNPTSPHTTADPPGNPHLLLKQKHIVHPSPYEVNKPPAVCCLKVLVEKSATRQGFGSRIHKTRWSIIPQFYWLLYFNVFKHLETRHVPGGLWKSLNHPGQTKHYATNMSSISEICQRCSWFDRKFTLNLIWLCFCFFFSLGGMIHSISETVFTEPSVCSSPQLNHWNSRWGLPNVSWEVLWGQTHVSLKQLKHDDKWAQAVWRCFFSRR